MDILLVSNSCSDRKYKEICSKRTREMIDPQQKFFRLLAEGMACDNNTTVKVMPVLPLSASSYPQRVFHHEIERENGVEYDYVPFYNGRILRYVTLFFSMFYNTLKWCGHLNDKENSFLITDPLMMMASMPARLACKIMGVKTCALVTDVPIYVTYMRKDKKGLRKEISKIYNKIADTDTKKFDKYITLTESINSWVNIKNKPYIVIEGVADYHDTSISEVYGNVLMYAGGVYEMYGVKTLVDAFIKLGIEDVELHIYGKGTYTYDIEQISKVHPNIKYMGCLPPEGIVQKEKEALLLINPRPCDEAFSKYSFPSKTIEYMLSGTPVVSTKLPGIPPEYNDYIYFFESDSEKDISEKLYELLIIDRNELRKKGRDAHKFILNNKTSIKQASKILDFLKETKQG